MQVFNLRTLSGLGVWLVAVFSLSSGTMQDEISLLLLFGILVITPLGIELGRRPSEESNIYSAAKYLQPFAALVTAISFFLPPGVLAGTLAIAWVPLTALLAADAMRRLIDRRIGALEEAAIDLGALYLLFGAGWLWASRMGLTPFGLNEPVTLLVAVHFLFAGFGGVSIAGLAGRYLRKRDGVLSGGFGIPALLIMSGPVLVSSGHMTDPVPEFVAVVLLATGYIWLATILVFNIGPTLENRVSRLLLTVSAGMIVLTMALALLFAAGNASRMFYIPVSEMARYHGWLNAVGFVLPGLLGWAFESRKKE